MSNKEELINNFLKERDKFIQKLIPYLNNLKNYGSDYFGYREFDKNGNSFGFSTNNNWYTLEFSSEFYRDMGDHFEEEIMHLYNNNSRYVTRSKDARKNKYLDALDQNGMGNSLVVYEFRDNKIESFFFNSSCQDSHTRDIMINNLSNIQGMINILSTLIHDIKQDNQEYVSKNLIKLEFKTANYLIFKEYSQRKKGSLRVTIDNKSILLTQREIEVLSFIKSNYNSKEISRKLNLSSRTVEGFISKLKSKFGVHSRADLIRISNRPELQFLYK